MSIKSLPSSQNIQPIDTGMCKNKIFITVEYEKTHTNTGDGYSVKLNVHENGIPPSNLILRWILNAVSSLL